MPTTTHEPTPTARPPRRPGRSAAAPLLAAVAVLAVIATAVAARELGRPDDEGATAPGSTDTSPSASTPASTPAEPEEPAEPGIDVPVAVGLDLHVGGEQVPGRWYAASGRGTRWIALRDDRTWWWGFDAEPRRMDGEIDQPPVMSPGGGYVADVLTGTDGGWSLSGFDTEWGGEGLGGIDLPQGPRVGPPPRAIAVTDDGLVVAGGPTFQWLWRPLVDGRTVDLAETAPGQAVISSTDAGLVVNAGQYDRTDGQQGEPYLARIAEDGTLTRLASLPTHDVLEAGEQWVAWVPPGTVGGEASGTGELQVQRRDGTDAGVLTAPAGWLFMAPGFRWESADRLLALVVSRDGQHEALVRCRPETELCEAVEPAG